MSDSININAWVLHKKNSGETSANVTFFTREKGVITSLCRGARTIKMQSLLQQFNCLWVSFSEKSNYFYVNKVELASPALPLSGDKLFAGLYVNELLYYSCRQLDDHIQLYDLYEKTLHSINDSLDKLAIEVGLRRFEIGLLSSVGYGLDLTYEAKTMLPICVDCEYNYIPEVGLIKVDNGIAGAHIHAMANNDFKNIETIKIAKKIMRKCVDNFLDGREIKSRGLYLVKK